MEASATLHVWESAISTRGPECGTPVSLWCGLMCCMTSLSISYLTLHGQQGSPTNKVFSTIDHQDAPCQSITSGANTGVNDLLDTWLGSSGVVFGAVTIVSSEAPGPWKWACKDTGTSTQKTMQSCSQQLIWKGGEKVGSRVNISSIHQSFRCSVTQRCKQHR